MNTAEAEQLIWKNLESRLQKAGLNQAQVDSSASLIELGVVDSFGFLELITGLEDATGIFVDFAELDPEEFTSVAGLARSLIKCMS